MKRFSPKQILSNIATAVRETVDSVNAKSFAVIAIVLMASSIGASIGSAQSPNAVRLQATQADGTTGGATPGQGVIQYVPAKEQQAMIEYHSKRKKDARAELLRACAQDKQTDDAAKAACDEARRVDEDVNADSYARADRDVNKCSQFAESVKSDGRDAAEACNKAGFAGRIKECYASVNSCQDQETEELGNLDPEDEPSNGAYCNKVLATKCSGLSMFNDGRDYRTEERESRKDAREMKSQLDDLMKEKRQTQLDVAKQRREFQENRQNQELASRKAEREIAEDIKKSLEGVKEQQKKAFDSALETYNAMEVEYIKMRKEARDAEDMVTQAKDDLQVMCRVTAEKKYNDAEKLRQTALAARKKNLGASSNVSGSAKRTKAALMRARQADFVAYFNECFSTNSAEGKGGQNRIATAERARDSAKKLLDDKSAMIEKQRSQMLEKLKAMENDATNQQSKIVTEMNDRIVQLSEEKALMAQKNDSREREIALEGQANEQNLQQRIDSTNKYLLEAQTEENVATSRLACLGTAGRRSESRRDRTEEGFGASLPAIKNTEDTCTKMKSQCNTAATSIYVPGICKDIEEGVKKRNDSRSRYKKI